MQNLPIRSPMACRFNVGDGEQHEDIRHLAPISLGQGGRAFIDAELIKPRRAVLALDVLFPVWRTSGKESPPIF